MRFFKTWLASFRLHAFGRLMEEFSPYRLRIALIFFLGLIISAIQPASVKLSQRIIDELHTGLSPRFFKMVPLALIGIFLVSGFAKYFYATIRRTTAEKIIIGFRARLFEKFLWLPLSVTDKKRTGDMLASIQNDLVQVGNGMDTLCDVIKEPFTFLGLMGIAFYCDWRLTLCTLLVAPIVALLFSQSGAAVKRYSSRNLSQFSDLLSLTQESLVGARIIKVFGLEEALQEKFHSIHDRYFKTICKSIRVQELATPLVEFIGALLIAGVLVYGGYATAHGMLTAGKLVAFVIAIGLAQMPLKQLNNAYLKLKLAEAALERVYAILDFKDTKPLRRVGRSLGSFERSIRYEHVGLWYDDKKAVDDISFEANAGDCIALVGLSGSGKTSVVNLLPRLYEVSAGSIRIDGVDIREIELGELRRLMSFVTQDTFLFHDSIYENIRYGNPTATRRQVERAAEMAHCTEFIRRCPEGFNTLIGDRGVCLSGGERQRVAIARAVLKGAPILVLDEATSSLDSHSEAVVQTALDELMVGKTSFVVAHRFSTVRRASRIYVLENGRVRETGTHDELLGRKGIYQGLFDRQSLAYERARVETFSGE